MFNEIKNMAQVYKGKWASFPRTKKTFILISVLITVAVSIGFLLIWTNGSYYYVYKGLEVEEIDEITGILDRNGIEYRVNKDAGGVLVPASKVGQARMLIATTGGPQGNIVGWELMDKYSLGLTEFAQNVNYKRALEGELSRTIMTIEEVDRARVHLVISKETYFLEEKGDTKASVILKMKNHEPLSPSVINGIIYFVSGAVEGLKPENVTLLDTEGRLLSKGGETIENSGILTNSQVKLQQEIERDYARKIVNLLEPIVGAGNVKAKVTVELDFTRIESTEETYNPDNSAVRSEKRREQQIRKGLTGVGNTSKEDRNKSNMLAVSPQGYTIMEDEEIKYDVSKTIKHVVEPTGSIARLSVAVLINDHVKFENTADGELNVVTTPRSAEEMKKIKLLAINAVGYNEVRGDQVSVENFSFQVSPPYHGEKLQVSQTPVKLKTYINYVVYGTLLFLAYILIIKPFVKSINRGPLKKLYNSNIKNLETSQETGKAGFNTDSRYDLDGSIDYEKLHDTKQVELLRKKVIEMVNKNPEMAAQTIRLLISEN